MNEQDIDKIKRIIGANLQSLKDLSRNFRPYQNAQVDLVAIVCFLLQFSSPREVEIMLRLLQRIDFVDEKRMTYLLKKAFHSLPAEITANVIISTLGTAQDSSALVCYRLLKTLFDDEQEVLSLLVEPSRIGTAIIKNKPSAIIFFDDNITSGTQLKRFVEELVTGRADAEIIKTPLTSEELENLKQVPIRFCYAYDLSPQNQAIIQDLKEQFKLDIEVVAGKVDYNNYVDFQCDTMKTEEEAEFSRAFIKRIAFDLYQDKEWDKNTLYNRLLGYGDLGKLTVFYYNVPKSLIPVFWKYGIHKERPWIPLFPEVQEDKKMVLQRAKHPLTILNAARDIIENPEQVRRPKLVVGFLVEGALTHEVVVPIPSRDFLDSTILLLNDIRDITPSPNAFSFDPINDLQTQLQNIYPSSPHPSYSSYLSSVADYNTKLQTFKNAIKDFIYQYSSKHQLTLCIDNTEGDKTATNCRIKLFYNTSQILINRDRDIEEPRFDSHPPKVSDFLSGKANPVVLRSGPPMYDLSVFGGYKKKKIIADTDETTHLRFDNVEHNDSNGAYITIIRSDSSSTSFDIPYELNFEEDGETYAETLRITFQEVDDIDKDLKDELIEKVRGFKKMIPKS